MHVKKETQIIKINKKNLKSVETPIGRPTTIYKEKCMKTAKTIVQNITASKLFRYCDHSVSEYKDFFE